MNLEVTSISKRSEPLSDAAAAVDVITREEFLNAGARSLRAGPGATLGRQRGELSHPDHDTQGQRNAGSIAAGQRRHPRSEG